MGISEHRASLPYAFCQEKKGLSGPTAEGRTALLFSHWPWLWGIEERFHWYSPQKLHAVTSQTVDQRLLCLKLSHLQLTRLSFPLFQIFFQVWPLGKGLSLPVPVQTSSAGVLDTFLILIEVLQGVFNLWEERTDASIMYSSFNQQGYRNWSEWGDHAGRAEAECQWCFSYTLFPMGATELWQCLRGDGCCWVWIKVITYDHTVALY